MQAGMQDGHHQGLDAGQREVLRHEAVLSALRECQLAQLRIHRVPELVPQCLFRNASLSLVSLALAEVEPPLYLGHAHRSERPDLLVQVGRLAVATSCWGTGWMS